MSLLNKWSEDRIFETVATPRLLAAAYPDGNSDEGEKEWYAFCVESNQTSVDLLHLAQERGIVAGNFATPFGNYAIVAYVTSQEYRDLTKGVEIEDLSIGAVHVSNMGRRALIYPMLGATGWGGVA